MNKRRKKTTKSKYKWIVILIVFGIFILLFYFSPIIQYHIRNLFHIKQNDKLELKNSQQLLSGYTVYGIDVSQYQKIIVWEKVSNNADIKFAIIRSTAGKDHRDKYFTYNWKSAKEHNLIRGAYHYYRPNENSLEQANNYIKQVKLESGDLVPIIDIEDYSQVQSLNRLKTGLLNWINVVEQHYDIKPIIYTYYRYYIAHFANDERFNDYPFWLARYSNSEDYYQPGNNWIIWQYTETGRILGVEKNVDLNVFNGDIEKLHELCIK
jgi:lysozyme